MTTTSDREVPAPLPCPFCGGEPTVRTYEAFPKVAMVMCADGCLTHSINIDVWNRRVSPSVAPPVLSEEALARRQMLAFAEIMEQTKGCMTLMYEDGFTPHMTGPTVEQIRAACSSSVVAPETAGARPTREQIAERIARHFPDYSLRHDEETGTNGRIEASKRAADDVLALLPLPSRLSEEVQKPEKERVSKGEFSFVDALRKAHPLTPAQHGEQP